MKAKDKFYRAFSFRFIDLLLFVPVFAILISSCVREDIFEDYFTDGVAFADGRDIDPVEEYCFGEDTGIFVNVKWMEELVDKYAPSAIKRYNLRHGYGYYFMTPGRNYLYDCFGYSICSHTKEERSVCSEFIRNLNKGVVVYQAPPPWRAFEP